MGAGAALQRNPNQTSVAEHFTAARSKLSCLCRTCLPDCPTPQPVSPTHKPSLAANHTTPLQYSIHKGDYVTCHRAASMRIKPTTTQLKESMSRMLEQPAVFGACQVHSRSSVKQCVQNTGSSGLVSGHPSKMRCCTYHASYTHPNNHPTKMHYSASSRLQTCHSGTPLL
jgi:hypothetical protein